MNNNKYFADMYVHLHSDSLFENRSQLDQELCEYDGVFSVHFDNDEYRNAMFVSYNPETISSDDFMVVIRKHHVDAVSVAGSLTRVSDSAVARNNK